MAPAHRPQTPVLHGAGKSEGTGLGRGPSSGGAAQVDALRCSERQHFGLQGKPRHLTMQAQEQGRARPAPNRMAMHDHQLSVGVGECLAFGIQHDHPRLRPQTRQGRRVIAQGIGTADRLAGESEAVQLRREEGRGFGHGAGIIRSDRAGFTC